MQTPKGLSEIIGPNGKKMIKYFNASSKITLEFPNILIILNTTYYSNSLINIKQK